MTVLAIMQNMWVRDPANLMSLLKRESDPVRQRILRRRIIAYALFAGCLSGRRLRTAFGELCDTIIWDEASPQIGGRASMAFPADLDHLRQVVGEIQPDIIVTFGTIARDGITAIAPHAVVLHAPHPAARHATIGVELNQVAQSVRALIAKKDPA